MNAFPRFKMPIHDQHRDMPTLARLYIMRVLFIENPVSQVVASSWVEKEKLRFVQCDLVNPIQHFRVISSKFKLNNNIRIPN